MMRNNRASQILKIFFLFLCRIQMIILTAEHNEAEERILETWSDNVKDAVESFIHEYESLHRVKVLIGRLEKTNPFELGVENSVFGILKLNFSFHEENGSEIQTSVYLKVPELGIRYSQAKDLLCYDKEKYMYDTILPLIYGPESQDKFSPLFYGATDADIVVVENIRESGFHPIGGLVQDLTTCKLVFETLAQFHAWSITRLNEQNMKELDFFNEMRSYFFGFDNKFDYFIFKKFVKHQVPRIGKNVLPYVTEVVHGLKEANDIAYTVDENAFNVVIIGDPNRMNVFFQEDEEKKIRTRCKFVDFQMSRRGSPVIDLVNYLMTSVEIEIVEQHGDELFRHYLNELEKHLTSDRYDLENLVADLQKYKPYFMHRLTTLICQFQTNFAPSHEAEAQEEDDYDFLFRSPEFNSYYERWMLQLVKW